MHQLLIEDQRLEMQNEHQLELLEETAKINTAQQIAVLKAQEDGSEGDENKGKTSRKTKFSVATGRGAGRPNRSGRTWDSSGNYEGRNGWDRWNATH